MSALAPLARFARPGAGAAEAAERCELCAEALPPTHAHLVDLEREGLACACRACALLFADGRAARARYRAVTGRVLVDPAFVLSGEEWSRLQIPVRLAFVSQISARGRWVAVYPGAAGPMRADVADDAWAALRERPLVAALAPDVEALLVYGRRGEAALASFGVSIDRCYALVGLVRRHWRGFGGGSEVWRAVEDFFTELGAAARPLPAAGGAP
jgi:hypothetical protein